MNNDNKVMLYIAVGAVLVFMAIGGLGYIFGWFGEAAKVAQEEFGPRAALEKYEWFIDQSASIDKLDQDVSNFQNRYEEVDRNYSTYGAQTTWAPDVRVQYNHDKKIARDDLTAIVSHRNGLVQEYNAASTKFNWEPFRTEPNMPAEQYQELVIP